jgi:hypothetical protein
MLIMSLAGSDGGGTRGGSEMKRALIALLIIAPLAGAFAQERKAPFLQGISVFAGGAWSRYSEAPAVATIPELGPLMGSRAGAAVGILWEYRFGDHFFLDNGLQYARKGASVAWKYWDDLMGVWKYDLDVISNPITFRFKPWLRSSPYILAGYELSVIVGHRLTDSWPLSQKIRTSLKGDTYDFDFGLIGGAGAEIALGDWTLFSEVRYYHGLLDISKGTGALESYPVIKTRALMVLAGIRFKWKSAASESRGKK